MVGSTTDDIAASTGLGPQPLRFLAPPVEVGHVLVPLDGSPFAERALPVATWLATGLGGLTELVEVVPCDAAEESEAAIRYLDRVARSHHAAVWDVVERNEVGAALADTVAANPRRLVCLATHGRGRSLSPAPCPCSCWSTAAGRSCSSGLARVVKAPMPRSWWRSTGRRVTRCSCPSRSAGPPACGARSRSLPSPSPRLLDTGAGPRAPSPGPGRAGALRRLPGGAGRGHRVAVSGRAIYDLVSVRNSLVPFLDRTTALVVVGSRHRPGLGRMVLGSHAVRIVHDAAVPVLVVPMH